MLYQILPRFDYRYNPDSMRMFLKTLSGVRKKQSFINTLKGVFDVNSLLDYKFIIDCDGAEQSKGRISFYLQVFNDRQNDMVYNSLINMFQDKADVFERKEPLSAYKTVHTLYTQSEKHEHEKKEQIKSLATFNDDQVFMFVLGAMKNKTRITIDFTIRKSFDAGRSMFRGIATDVVADVMIKVSGKTKYQRNDILEITNTIINLTAGEKEMRAIYKDTYKLSEMKGNELMNVLQIPTFYQKPSDNKVLLRINKLEVGQRTVAEDEFTKGLKCGHVYHPMQNREICLDLTQLRKHMIITGQTGSGKSSVAEEIIRNILLRKAKGEKKVPGLSFFDPAETSVLGIIDMLLKIQADGTDITELTKIVHYVDFNYDECIFPISILNKDVPSTEILDYFKMLYGESPTIQVDRMMTSAINAILLDKDEHNIMDIPKLFRSEEMRNELLMKYQSNIYADDAIAFLKSKFNNNQVDPILNRTDPFMNTPQKKLMFGMSSKYDGLKQVKKWIDKGHIILYNLKGLNDFDNKIITGYIALKYYLIGLQRNDNSLLHLAFFDENHKTQFDVFQRWLAELRKSGLALVPMTQYLDQYNPDYLKALLGNVGTKISFRQGDDSARRLVSNLPGNVDKEGLKRLPDRIGYVSTEDNRAMKSILVEVAPPYRYNAGKVVPHPDPGEIQTQVNLEKNRNFAYDLMKRDFILKKDAERIVFRKQIREEEKLQEEKEMLEQGDALLWDD